ncbi:MAG: MarR family winged helix-turn-helix transcriptional regulator [Kofleriaceae bacterium]
MRSSLGNAIARLFRLVNRAHGRALKPHEVSTEQAHILSILWIEGPLAIGRLQRMLALSSPTLTGALDRMESQGLVRRVPSPEDRRVSLIEPRVPPKHRARIEATVDTSEAQLFSALTQAERKDLLRLLDKCIAKLDAQD